MLKPLKIKCEPDKLFVWSDFHHGHNKSFVYEKRGFKTVAEHDETLIARWNETVPADGVVFHLGDFQIQSDESKFWQLVRRLNFKTLHLCLGNHNSGQAAAYKSALRLQFPNAFPDHLELEAGATGNYEVYPLIVPVYSDPGKRVVFLPEYIEVHVGKTMLALCHYPISSWHHMSSGAIMVAGHTHGNLKEKLPLRLDVGVEVQPRPISLTEILRLTAGQTPAKVDHH